MWIAVCKRKGVGGGSCSHFQLTFGCQATLSLIGRHLVSRERRVAGASGRRLAYEGKGGGGQQGASGNEGEAGGRCVGKALGL